MTGKNILICPLEWGLGHAARMIPLAKRLAGRGCKIFIAAGPKHLSLFKTELQDAIFIEFTGFSPGYSRYLPQYLFMLLKTPYLLYHIVREHWMLDKIISQYNIEIVISDNRFGLWNRRIKSVYVTHLIRIPFPKPLKFMEIIGMILHRAIIRQYALCFIPDVPGVQNLSGRLSHEVNVPANARFVGIMSRFDEESAEVTGEPENMITVILSGPEPQKSILKNILEKHLNDMETSSVILEGNPDKWGPGRQVGSVTYYNHLVSSELGPLLKKSRMIISRSGYTTIMDLFFLGKSALLVPTPGQTEQEYLAEYHSAKGWFDMITQKKLTRDLFIRNIEATRNEDIINESKLLLDKALNELLCE